MRTPEQLFTPTSKMPTTPDDRGTGDTLGRDRPPARHRMIVLATVFATLAVAATGTGVFAWQHGLVRDSEVALSIALQERDDVRKEAAALRAKVDALTGRTDVLRAQVGQLRGKLGRLHARVADLQTQLAAPAAAYCDPAAILAVIRQQVDVVGSWGSVDIQECRNGYARVYAHLRATPQGDAEQVFLRDVNGSWQVITSGTGISCSDQDIGADLRDACEALGLA